MEEETVKFSYLWRGLPGHPIHPPLTDATIGTYTFAAIAAFFDVVGITQSRGAYGWWIALVIGLIATVFTALTGFADWLTLEWGSEIWKTATAHMLAVVSATVLFALAAIFGHASYEQGDAGFARSGASSTPRKRDGGWFMTAQRGPAAPVARDISAMRCPPSGRGSCRRG
jgi:uncharacterized membrane protein